MNANQVADQLQFARIVRRYGWMAALKFCKNLGICMADVYVMAFGVEPRK
jgi:aminoglycoside/choline kinase family phosphotransferase